MITYEWCPALEPGVREEILGLVATAGKYDAEAGFSAIDPAEVAADPSSYAGQSVWHLIVRIAPDTDRTETAERLLAAYGRVIAGTMSASGQLQFVVHPDFRSRGIATTLMERMALDRAATDRAPADRAATDREAVDQGMLDREGWPSLSSVRIWAHGDHPAADRLSRRFAIPAVDRTWKLVRYLSGKLALGLPVLTFPVAEGLELSDTGEAMSAVRLLAERSVSDDVGALVEHAGREGTRTVVAASDGVPVGAIIFDAGVADAERFPVGRIHGLVAAPGPARDAVLRALLVTALGDLGRSGAARGEIRLDPDDATLIRVGRLLGLEQEQADVCYRIDRPA